MSFLRKVAETVRAVGEGKRTAEAHRMAEALLGKALPPDVAADAYEIVSRMAVYSSSEQMAMIYVIEYAKRMTRYFDSIDPTPDFRMRVSRELARACILLADQQRSGTNFPKSWINELILVVRRHRVKTDHPKISFAI